VAYVVKIEGTLEEIRALLEQGKVAKREVKKAVKQAKTTVKKAKRAPSAYNKYMKKKLAALKKKHPKTPHATLFKRAAKSWSSSAERKRSMK
tara:strand:- start:500 stop:775 length:276 start_codon:yes stop_codon:yes gene_type:complete